MTSLPSTEQRDARVPSGWTPLELLSHLLHMERRWFVWGFLAEPVADPWGDWTVDDPWEHDDADESVRWHVADDVTAEDLVTRLDEVGARTRGVLRDFPTIARMWRSTGRGPHAQPPGRDTRASPYRARSGPRT